MPEIQDLRTSAKSFTGFGDFSTIRFTVVGLGEPRVVLAGVVSGSYFDVMGLHPVLGRLLDMRDDGPKPKAPSYSRIVSGPPCYTVILRDRQNRPSLQFRPASRNDNWCAGASIPYPTETEIIANIVTSPTISPPPWSRVACIA